MELSQLPKEILEHLPVGYEPEEGVSLVLPYDNGSENSITSVNVWARAEPPYPESLATVIWFGLDGVGNILGWDPERSIAVLWNPYDEEPFWTGTVLDLWQFILGGYDDAT